MVSWESYINLFLYCQSMWKGVPFMKVIPLLISCFRLHTYLVLKLHAVMWPSKALHPKGLQLPSPSGLLYCIFLPQPSSTRHAVLAIGRYSRGEDKTEPSDPSSSPTAAAVEHREHSTGVTQTSIGLQKHRNHNTLPNTEPPPEL